MFHKQPCRLSSLIHATSELHQANHCHFLSNILYTQPRGSCQLDKEVTKNLQPILYLWTPMALRPLYQSNCISRFPKKNSSDKKIVQDYLSKALIKSSCIETNHCFYIRRMLLFKLSVLSPHVQHCEIYPKKQMGGSASPLPIPHVCCCSWKDFHLDQILAQSLVTLLPLDSWRGNQALLWQHSSGTACAASLILLISPKRQRLFLAPSDQQVDLSDPNRLN